MQAWPEDRRKTQAWLRLEDSRRTRGQEKDPAFASAPRGQQENTSKTSRGPEKDNRRTTPRHRVCLRPKTQPVASVFLPNLQPQLWGERLPRERKNQSLASPRNIGRPRRALATVAACAGPATAVGGARREGSPKRECLGFKPEWARSCRGSQPNSSEVPPIRKK